MGGVGVSVGTGVLVGVDVSVGVSVGVAEGSVVADGVSVEAGGGSVVLVGMGGVCVANSMMIGVTVGMIGTFGTHNLCPTRMLVSPRRQLAESSCATVTP